MAASLTVGTSFSLTTMLTPKHSASTDKSIRLYGRSRIDALGNSLPSFRLQSAVGSQFPISCTSGDDKTCSAFFAFACVSPPAILSFFCSFVYLLQYGFAEIRPTYPQCVGHPYISTAPQIGGHIGRVDIVHAGRSQQGGHIRPVNFQRGHCSFGIASGFVSSYCTGFTETASFCAQIKRLYAQTVRWIP